MLLTSFENRDPLPAVVNATEHLRNLAVVDASLLQQKYDRSKTLDLCNVNVTAELADAILSLEHERRRVFCCASSNSNGRKPCKANKRRKLVNGREDQRGPASNRAKQDRFTEGSSITTPWQMIRFDNCYGSDARRLFLSLVRSGGSLQLFVRCLPDNDAVTVYSQLCDSLRSPACALRELLLMPGHVHAEEATKLAKCLRKHTTTLDKVGLYELQVTDDDESGTARIALARSLVNCTRSLSVVFGDNNAKNALAHSVLEAMDDVGGSCNDDDGNLRSLQVRSLTPLSPSQVVRRTDLQAHTGFSGLLKALPTLPIRELDISWLEIVSDDEEGGNGEDDDRMLVEEDNNVGNSNEDEDMEVDRKEDPFLVAWNEQWQAALRPSLTLESIHIDSVTLGPQIVHNCLCNKGGRWMVRPPMDLSLWSHILSRANRLSYRPNLTSSRDNYGNADVLFHFLQSYPAIVMENNR